MFVAGAYAGRWAVKNQVSARLRAAVEEAVTGNRQAAEADVIAEWSSRNTHLVRLETTVIHLPGSAEGWGGGLQALEDGRIFYATRSGQFGVLGVDRVARVLPFSVEMNIAGLKSHPASRLSNFREIWFRVTDIDLRRISEGRYELLVGHHFFDAANACVQLRLSRAEIVEQGAQWSLAVPFETLHVAAPCITFYHPGYEFAFEGHFSGGRIARWSADRVLFSTGDHGWMGMRGYPAVSAEDDSTLGKILLVDLAARTVKVFVKGVRNPQGLHIDSQGRIWETEHGPRGGDELNLITADQDYGWPRATYGTDYGPRPWAHSAVQGRHDAGTRPQFAWVPSIGVSNLLQVRGDEFALWKGDLLVLSLTGQSVHRLRLEGDRVTYDEPIRFDGQRLRDVAELPGGRIALLTDHGTIVLLRNGDRAAGAAPYLDAAKAQPLSDRMPPAERAAAVAGRFAEGGQLAKVSLEGSEPASPGLQVFRTNCAACHAIEGNAAGVGPSLRGVVGRTVGATDFAYSDALARRKDRWTGSRIVEFAADPKAIYPGTTMSPVQLSGQQRRDLEAYFAAIRP